MVLARCYLDGEVIQCSISILNNKLLVYSLEGNIVSDVSIESIRRIELVGNELLLIVDGKELRVSASEPYMNLIRDVCRVVELRINYASVVETLSHLIPLISKAFNSLITALTELSINLSSGWSALGEAITELEGVNKWLMNYGINIDELIDELKHLHYLRNVAGIKELIKKAIFNIVSSSKNVIRSLLKFENLECLVDILVLAYTAELARIMRQRLEMIEALTELNNLCISEIYLRVLDKSGTNLCGLLINSLESKGAPASIDEFLINFMNALRDKVARRE